jgi:hypothetical protein
MFLNKFSFVLLFIMIIIQGCLLAQTNDNSQRREKLIRIAYDSTVTEHILIIIPIHWKEKTHITGKLISFDSNSITISAKHSANNIVSFRTSQVKGIKVADGKRRSWLEGIGYGALFSLFPIAAATIGYHDPLDDIPTAKEENIAILRTVTVGISIGGAIG